jgi:periplasmic protein TonB
MSLLPSLLPSAPQARPACLGLVLGALLVVVVSACGKKEEAVPAAGTEPAAATQPVAPPAQAVSAEVAALSTDDLRKKASQAYQDSRLYAPAGDNAMEYYLALRDKSPGDPGVSSALTDLLPMTVIATEQSRDRGDFVEAQRLYGLIEKADKNHPSLARLKSTIATAQETEVKRAEEQKLTTEEETARKAQLEKDRLQQQQLQQQQAAQQLAAQQQVSQQAEQDAAAKRDADQKASAQREADQKAAQQRAAAQTAAEKPAEKPAAATSSDLRPVSTPAPRYPPEALRAGQSGEVQVEFTVGSDGTVTSARVVRSNPPRVFDREAVAAVKRWRFEPVAAPVTTRRTIGFNPGG